MTQIFSGVPLAYSEQKSKKFIFLHQNSYFILVFILNFSLKQKQRKQQFYQKLCLRFLKPLSVPGDMGLVTCSRVVSSQRSRKNLSASYRHVWMKTHNQLVTERLFHCLAEVVLSLADLGPLFAGNRAVLSPWQVWCRSAVASQVWVGDERCCQAPLNTVTCCEMLLVQPERSSYSSRYPQTERNCFDQQITLHKAQV